MTQIAKLALADGTVFTGTHFGVHGTKAGEVVFNTAMCGYQEIITDPSYEGQIVMMTYPLIGNYGVNREDVESRRAFLSGFVVRELSRIASNFRSELSLDEYLREQNVVGITGIDTRVLTRKLRTDGSINGVLSSEILDDVELVTRARAAESMKGRNLVPNVTASESYDWTEPLDGEYFTDIGADAAEKPLRVVSMDFGIKQGILRSLRSFGCEVVVVPATATASEIQALNPDGLLLSNGPGDPDPMLDAQAEIRRLVESSLPTFGICLGHQLLSLSLGAKTYKLKFGHHGANHPVKNLDTGEVEITSQNHGFAVDADSLAAVDIEQTHINLNDQTNEGCRHKHLPCFSVQYHPEASPGPHDASYLFASFLELMQSKQPVRF